MPSNKPDYQKNYIKQHYILNKDYYKEKAKLRNEVIRKSHKALADRFKMLKGCIDCGYKEHPEALHFDHVRGEKVKAVSSMISSCVGRETLKEEIRKCEVRCANCHAIATASRR